MEASITTSVPLCFPLHVMYDLESYKCIVYDGTTLNEIGYLSNDWPTFSTASYRQHSLEAILCLYHLNSEENTIL